MHKALSAHPAACPSVLNGNKNQRSLNSIPVPAPRRQPYLSSDLWISAIFLSSFSECLGKNWNLEL